ncbi:transcription-repair coupling factor Mfd [Desulfitobacterium dehalogenans ATCC 51507]|uniref:Transcription-repair-coupling factor n=1 Tax=Desulfitobacterium dehalogenans (strain ATCC 51507 / DSM 9161 / JW/IU-DC1) TaxID=756499 RepID=I4A3Q9_DESDJ|nr:transcription-repair coupling factor [Desulfitobacterium dehalogenans]AFL98593.1 transcription-repair coupling factor Mfd [Desulfitobacterium dehalogenans ATCC 51507]
MGVPLADVHVFVLPERKDFLKTLSHYLRLGFDIEAVDKAISYKEWPQMIYNLTGSQKPAFAAQLLKRGKPGLVITYSEELAQKWVNDLRSWLPEEDVLYFPASEWLPFEVLGKSRETTIERIRVLNRLAQDNHCTVVVPVLAVNQRSFSPSRWQEYILELKEGTSYDLKDLAQKLITAGYERLDVVDGKGQFAIRGGIMDIAPLDGEPLRIEFFDDEVDSIRVFDLETQKSTETLKSIKIAPALEVVIRPEEFEKLGWEVRAQARKQAGRLSRSGRSDVAEQVMKQAQRIEERLKTGRVDESIYPYLSLLSEPLEPFFSLLSQDRYVILDEPLRLKEQLEFQQKERLEEYTQALAKGEEFYSPEDQFVSYEQLLNYGEEHPFVLISTLPRQIPGVAPKRIFNLNARPLTGFMGKTGILVDEIEHWQKSGHIVTLFVGDEEHADRMLQGLRDRGALAKKHELNEPVQEGGVYVYPSSIDQGFELPLSKLIVLSEAEIYKRERKAPMKRRKTSEKTGQRLQFADLKSGDFVVHVHHGIGQFIGIERISVGGVDKDYFSVKYAGQDKLYVPLDQLNLLQKYLGSDAETLPKLYKLGGSEWKKVKSKAKSAIKEMAFDLVKLYAQREATKGYAFSPDNVWQQEFEEKFPYQETPDQMQCIIEVKQDMMRQRPMDRLLCGDVGYGKTEVALRAAFKAVMDSRQVAVLVPTTILAQQHFNTFQERFMGYPVSIQMLSRFRSAKEQKLILQGLKEGSIDIVVGTHKLVADSVKFKELGLLIVDEEQRFGVAHKEKLKTLKTNVDVLTLSATPIPRTLHMSLVGVRDLSVIETPPEDRFPVQTYVAEFRPDVVREAIRREIQRGGQVFFVHNRVEDMEQVVHFLSQLVPEARYGIAHGQMSEKELEQEMLAFLEHESDVLVCTTIIETGLDMPNVNTLIIDEADRLGLGQLYQLRGRVGRSNRRAYSYFLYKPQKVLTEVAEKRLAAIREFTEFGSGLKIAMRDLEIRGAGNLIGAQQHGHLAALGFELYSQMLKEAVQEIKGEKVEEKIETSIEVQVDAYLPDIYIGERQLKAALYQRMVSIDNEEDLSLMIDELIDRFGTPPREVENLLKIVRIKWIASRMKIEQIQQVKQQVVFRFAADPGISGEMLMTMATQSPYPVSFGTTGNGNLEIKVRLRSVVQEEILEAIHKTLMVFNGIASKSAS